MGTLNSVSEEVKKEMAAKEQQIAQLRGELNVLRAGASGMPVPDYELKDASGKTVKLSEAFGDRDQMVLVHNMGFRCPYCTMWADGFNGLWRYVQRRAAFVLVSNDAPEKQKRGAESRGWKFPMLSADGTTLFEDLGFKGQDESTYGVWWPGVSTLYKDADGNIHRHSSAFFGPGDDFNSAWHFFDLLRDKVEEVEPTEGISDPPVTLD